MPDNEWPSAAGDWPTTTQIGIGSAAPVLPVHSLDAAVRFYQRLGFDVRRYDAGYAYAEREDLQLHLRASPELEQFSAGAEVYAETARVDELHAEWLPLDFIRVRTIVTADMRTELRRRWAAGDPVGVISAQVTDTPWGVREFSVRDPDNNQLRFGRRRIGASPSRG
ncbi:MAG: VOC family protein [Acidobacteriota bacterium]|nr:VOC family protein [Acidobacteriota bacterium]